MASVKADGDVRRVPTRINNKADADDFSRNGGGDVIWVSQKRPVEAVVDWLRTVV
ncbi:MAG TPA: hypothetical protein VFQ42_20925 [Mycobacterium sp.]|nr:hypothetical protein [Mycobacterium sp.]